jgi:hypothetical protein
MNLVMIHVFPENQWGSDQFNDFIDEIVTESMMGTLESGEGTINPMTLRSSALLAWLQMAAPAANA